ncbi:hypothetical protein AJ79_03707 [Helicocarpus griseus UAMH5409]|uniref:Glutathione S-transferase n=1 Tax=Helicocarpus griseus UAMH5409 TaxID=1447875 RepID=A0A2B7XXY7_9EURO|nr:hypothetical protein AJ79_03707 [Helicocarpus griseus UAMH5409]
MVSFTVPDNYGNVLAIALGVIPFLSFAHGAVVGVKRKASGINYPHAYATPEQCKQNPIAYKFNCAQRAHANFLENMPQTMLYTVVAGLKYPNATAALSATWVVMRILFLYGYVYSDKPNGEGRYYGMLSWFAQAGLWALSAFGMGSSIYKLDSFWGS